MSTIKSSAEDLTLNADGSGNDIKFQSNAVEKASIDQDGVITTGGASLDGAVTINESGADVDFRVESDTVTHALFVEGSDGKVGIGAAPDRELTVSGGNSRINILSSTSDASQLQFGDAANSQVGRLYYEHADNSLRIHTNDVEHMRIDEIGAVTKPLQPAFSVYLSNHQLNIATGGWSDILFDTEVFDTNADFNTTNYTFTAPVTGKYQLSFHARLDSIDTGAGYYQIRMFTSNRPYYWIADPDGLSQDPTYGAAGLSVLADMDASDTAIMSIYQGTGSAQMDIINDQTYFQGILVA